MSSADLLAGRIRKAATAGTSIDLIDFDHAKITRALHALVHCDPHNCARPLYVEVALQTKRAGSFPLRCLPPVAEAALRERERELHVGLCSGRHFELDRVVDLYLLRDRDVTDASENPEKEKLAYQAGTDLLQSAGTSGCAIRLYHTGLEPLVLGFYRAAAEVGRMRRVRGDEPLCVIPMLKSRWNTIISLALKDLTLQLCREHEHYFAFDAHSHFLGWRLERPMIEAERDRLTERYPALAYVLGDQYSHSQYSELQPWG